MIRQEDTNIILLSDGFDKGGLFDWDESTDSIIAKAAEKMLLSFVLDLEMKLM